MKRPVSLLIISVLYLIGGVLAIWDVVSGLFQNRISINFAVCLLFVGIGLLKFKASSRRWAIAWIVLGYLICAILLFGYFLAVHACTSVFHVTFRGEEVRGPLRFVLGSGIPLTFALLLCWMHRTLRRPEIVALFLSQK